MNRFTGPLLLAVLAALVVLAHAFVAARVFEEGEAALAEAQLDHVLSDTRETIERNLQLGLPLPELQQVPPVLEEVRNASPFIVAADVFDLKGVTVFSTDRGAVGEPVPPRWMRAVRQSRNARGLWQAREDITVTIGAPLENDFGQTEGWIAIIMEREALSAPLSRAPGATLAALPYAVLAAFLAGLGAWVLLPRLDRSLDGLEAALAARTPVASETSSAALAVDGAIARTRQAEVTVDAAEREMMALDAEV